MWTLALLLFLQAGPPQREIIGPFVSREDQGQTTKVVLKNGLTVIVREEYAVPLAGITALVKAGHFDEEDRVSGISNLIALLHSTGDTRSLGGDFTATASAETTVYRITVPAANAFAALGVQADALLRPSFDDEALKRTIETVLHANERLLDTPAALASEKLNESAFTEHRMKRWKTGTADGLRALTRGDITAHYQKYYRPSNMILAIVGALDREKVLQEVVKLYASAEDVPVERDVSPPEPAQDGLRYAWSRGPIQQSHIAIGFHTPGVLHEDARALEVLAAILGTGRASRLHEILRDRKSLITSGSARLHAFRDIGFFQVNLETASSLEAAIAALAEFENVKRFGVTQEMVARAKASIAADYFRELESVSSLSEGLAYYESLGDWKGLFNYLDDVQKVTPQGIVEVARRYLASSNLSVFEYLSNSVERYLSAAEYRAAVVDKVEGAVERRNEPELPVTAQIPQRGTTLVTDAVGTIQRRSIVRGPDVYILEDRRLPIVSFGIFFPGGRLLETENNAGITELMLRSALRGAGNFTGADLARGLENAGARIRIVNQPDFFGYMLHGLAGRLDQALKILVDVLQNPRFDEADVLSERALQLADIRSRQDDTASFATGLFMQSLFGDHPYSRTAFGTESGISRLTGTQLREWFRNNQRKIVPTIIIVGDTRGTALVAPIADALTNEDLMPRDILSMPRAMTTAAAEPTVETADRHQTTLVYGFPGVNRTSGDRHVLDLVATLISGTNASHARGGALFTTTDSSPNKETDARTAIEVNLARIRKEALTAAQLTNVVQYTLASRATGLQSRESRVLDFAHELYSGATLASTARYDAAIRGVTVDQVRSAIEKYLAAGALRMGIVRGKL